MRIALLADIHGNAFALERVLAEVAAARTDVVACLGDIAVLGPDPATSIDLVRSHADVVVRGNTDEWLIDSAHPELADSFSREITTWTQERIGDERQSWISTLPLVGAITGVTVVHATMRNTTDVVTDRSPEAVFATGFEGAAIVVAGHIHLQMDHRAKTTRYINAGSVGLPGAGPDVLMDRRRRSPDAAEWALLDIDGDDIGVSFRRTPLPIREMAEWAAGFDFPLLEWWRARWAGCERR